MSNHRSQIPGLTDYSGIDLNTMIVHLQNWLENTLKTITILKNLLVSVNVNNNRLDNPINIESYLLFFIDLFERYSADFARLTEELPCSVEQRHVDILGQIYEGSETEITKCINFKRDHIEIGLKDESLRSLVEDILYNTRDRLFDYHDISNLAYRMKTFIGTKRKESDFPLEELDALELKPNFFGIGINFNHLIKLLSRFIKSK